MSKLKAKAWMWGEGDVVYRRFKTDPWMSLEDERKEAVENLGEEVTMEASLRSDGRVEVHEQGKKMKTYRNQGLAKVAFLLRGWRLEDE